MNTYAPGAGVVLTFTFQNEAGVATDPTTVAVEVEQPGGVITTYALADLTRLAVGVYTLEIVVEQAGRWHYRAASTGALVSATPDQAFYVEASRFVP